MLGYAEPQPIYPYEYNHGEFPIAVVKVEPVSASPSSSSEVQMVEIKK